MTKTFITTAEDFDDALADLVAEFRGRGKQVIDPYDMKEQLRQVANFTRYPEDGNTYDYGEDAMQTCNACIEAARRILGLPEESDEEAERRNPIEETDEESAGK